MPNKNQLPPEIFAQRRRERREAERAAAAFADMCRRGDAQELDAAACQLDDCGGDAWRIAMRKVAGLGLISGAIQEAFIPIWVERKHLSLTVGDRPICAAALRVLLPGNYQGEPLTYIEALSALNGGAGFMDFPGARTWRRRGSSHARWMNAPAWFSRPLPQWSPFC
jgi:hypothetical protein